ncbi:MAG: hypothetical protein DMG72_19200 [Acidobacteria bacterium]|nr:MAG: hypothetical protein DMG72_19200 [Acidobacteriota bacterium]
MNRRQTIPKYLRFTVEDFHSKFPSNDACLEFLKEKRCPSGVTYCHKCQQERKHYRVTGRPTCGEWTLAIQPALDEPGSKPGSGLSVVP